MIGLFWKKALIHTFTHELIQQDVAGDVADSGATLLGE